MTITHGSKFFCAYILLLLLQSSLASSTLTTEQLKQVKKTDVSGEQYQQRLKEVAILLAEYEIEAKRLTNKLNELDRTRIDLHADKLIEISELVIDWARIRLVQCDAYLHKTLELKGIIKEIEHEAMERDYHHDGVLPKAPPECYHIKDMFVHPASVLILTRDDPKLQEQTLASINAEISEVLGHTEAVRHLVIY